MSAYRPGSRLGGGGGEQQKKAYCWEICGLVATSLGVQSLFYESGQ